MTVLNRAVVPLLFRPAALLLAAFVATSPAAAQPAPPSDAPPRGAGGLTRLLPGPATTEHAIRLAAGDLRYRATAATLSLLGGEGQVTAEVFHVAYDRIDPPGAADAPTQRPVTFVFNGGPGAASAYLHLGALGPKVLVTSANGELLTGEQRLEDNPDTWLAFTDLVFVDPVGTGYSRAAPGEDQRTFWGVESDASSIGAFIRLYLQRTGRTDAPVYLAGESYGGFRAALLAKTLQEDNGITPRGIVLVSPALEFSLLYADDFSPLKWALMLPAMAAVNFERQGLGGDALAAKLTEVERFAMSEYLTALASGLEPGGRAISEAVAGYVGLPVDLVRRHFGRVPVDVFVKEFDRGKRRTLSRYDGTIGTADMAPESAYSRTPDPLLDRSVPVLTEAFVTYVREELGFKTDISYRLLNREVLQAWDFGTSPSRQGYAGVLEDLQEARALNPNLKVLIAHGMTDLVTPYFASTYLIAQTPKLDGTPPIRTALYRCGHMMYFCDGSRRGLTQDAAALYPGNTAPARQSVGR